MSTFHPNMHQRMMANNASDRTEVGVIELHGKSFQLLEYQM